MASHTPAALAAFDIASIIEQRRAAGDPWLEFFRVPALSLGLYVLAAGSEDLQTPHGQDEIYYVLSGKATLRVNGEETPATPGAVLYVAAEADHRFHTIEEELTLLIFFAPAYERRPAAD
jgi:mannose-6-phosphate isomerase-like protein (cupin superfamily)